MRGFNYFYGLIFFIFLPKFCLGQEEPVFDKSMILKKVLGEWEREAEDYEKNSCKKADRFILSLIDSNNKFKSDGYAEYFTYLSTDKNKRICYLEHPSYSFVFIDLMKNDTSIYFHVTGYLWSADWKIEILNDDKIIIDNKHYKKCHLIKNNDWYRYNNTYYDQHKKIDRFIKRNNKILKDIK